MTDAGIEWLAVGFYYPSTEVAAGCQCPQLSELDLDECFKVKDAGIEKLAAGCLQLSSLLLGCFKVTDAGIAALAAGCPQLFLLTLSKCCEVTDAGGSRAWRKAVHGSPHSTSTKARKGQTRESGG